MSAAQHRALGSKCGAMRAAVCFVVVTLCAVALFFGWSQSQYVGWQYDSEGLVIGRMYQLQTGQTAGNPAGFLGGFDTAATENDGAACAYDQLGLYFDNTPVVAQEYWAYTHQSGAQGFGWGLANRMLCLLSLSAQARLTVLHFVSVWLLCAAALAVCVWVKSEWGALPAVLCGTGLLLSPWILRACANLYWQLWLYVALFALSAFVARACESKERLGISGAALLFVGALLRFLCGFEFVSCVLVCMEVPFVYYFVKHCGDGKQMRMRWLRAAVVAGLAGLGAFAAAMLAWFVQLWVHLGSAAQAVAEMLVPIANRTGVLGAAQAGYGESLSVPLSRVLKLYFVDDAVLPGVSVLTLLCVYGVVLAVTLALCAKRNDMRALKSHAAMAAAVVTGVLAVLSWLVLARGHSAVHPHINYILWMLPFVPLCCAQLGACAQTVFYAVYKPRNGAKQTGKGTDR